jgi:hypothetical protein
LPPSRFADLSEDGDEKWKKSVCAHTRRKRREEEVEKDLDEGSDNGSDKDDAKRKRKSRF